MPRSACVNADVDQTTQRPWITTGVALAGAGLLALTPALHTEIPAAYRAPDAAAVRLAAELSQPYVDAFNTASTNASTLAGNFFLAPGLPLQQAIVNQADFLQQLLDDPSNADAVVAAMRSNLEAVLTGLTLIGADADTTSTVTNHTVDGLHGLILQLLPQFLPSGGIDPSVIATVMNVLASPLSGVLIGVAGPFISPAVATLNSAITIAGAIQAGDMDAAFADVWATPADVIGSFFNGATLDLTALTPLINDSGLLGSTTLNSLDIAFGGLFTPGSIGRGSYDLGDAGELTAPGGSILNSVGMNVTTDALGVPITLDIPGNAVGPIGALEGMSQTIGALLGDGWDGKNGKPVPPLAGLHFPTLSDSTSSTDVNAMLTTLLGGAEAPTTSTTPSSDAPADAGPAVKAVTFDVGSSTAPDDAEAQSATAGKTTTDAPLSGTPTGSESVSATTESPISPPPSETTGVTEDQSAQTRSPGGSTTGGPATSSSSDTGSTDANGSSDPADSGGTGSTSDSESSGTSSSTSGGETDSDSGPDSSSDSGTGSSSGSGSATDAGTGPGASSGSDSGSSGTTS